MSTHRWPPSADRAARCSPRRPGRAALIALLVGGAACADPFEVEPPPEPLDPRVNVVALTGPDLTVLEGSTVVLSGAGSRALSAAPELDWSQVDGPPVLLTNPSAAVTTFVAPLAPAALTFELSARAGAAVAFDRVRITVQDAPPNTGPAFLVVPPDVSAPPGSSARFEVDVLGAARDGVVFSARTSCAPGATAEVEGASVEVTLPEELPCMVVLEGRTAEGARTAPAARVFWPLDTALPEPIRVLLPSRADPDAPITLTVDPEQAGKQSPSTLMLWAADGSSAVLPRPLTAAPSGLVAPRVQGRYVLAAERRLGLASGGIHYALLDVTSGAGNIAPHAVGGPDRLVQPGARFRVDVSGSFDRDGDDLTPTIKQVLGPSAAPDTSAPGAFVAPASGDLLFHVAVDDGTVRSAPDSVRVVVSPAAINQPPQLVVESPRYVSPGQIFVLDASAAEDPDSGIIAAYSIAQAPADPVVLLPEPVSSSSVTLTATAAGDRYRFLLSAYDDEGLGVTAELEVVVEDAGPYVDPVRGTDDGNGTAALPFRSIEGALTTAARHALPDLLLSEGEHLPVSGLPPGLGLRGGLRFDGVAYVSGGGTATVPLTGLVVVEGATITSLTLQAEPGAALQLAGSSSLLDARVEAASAHAGDLLLVSEGASAVLENSSVMPASSPTGAVVVAAGATLSVTTSTIGPAIDGSSVSVPASGTGISCTAATVILTGSAISGGAGGDRSLGVEARDGCRLDVLASTVVGGGALDSVGIDARDALITIDGNSTVIGALSPPVQAQRTRAVAITGRTRTALIQGALHASDEPAVDDAAALEATNARVQLLQARLEASSGVAVSATGSALDVQGATLGGRTAALVSVDADALSLDGGSITGNIGLELTGTSSVQISNANIESTELAIRARGVPLSVRDSTLTVAGIEAATVMDVDAAVLVDSSLTATAARALGVTTTSGDLSLVRTAVQTLGQDDAVAVTHGTGTLNIDSSLLVAVASDASGSSIAVVTDGATFANHATLLAGSVAIELQQSGSADVTNSLLRAATTVVAPSDTAAVRPWTRAVALALDAPGAFIAGPTARIVDAEELAAAGCQDCIVVSAAQVVDESGHLRPGENPLVDAADPFYLSPLDIDGESRPRGLGPDIGCDERP